MDQTAKIESSNRSFFSTPVFAVLYGFFIINTLVTPWEFEKWLVQPHARFAIGATLHLYKLMETAPTPAVHVLGRTANPFSAGNFHSFLWIAYHNSLLGLIAISLFTCAAFLPQGKHPIAFHLLGYVRFILVLLFFAFAAAIFVINATLIPFILASVAYAASVPLYHLSLLILIHGVIEYAALALLITIGIQAWRFTVMLAPDVKVLATANPARGVNSRRRGLLALWFAQWYASIFSNHSFANRFRQALRPHRRSTYRMYGFAILVFCLAAVVEVYLSPRFDLLLL